MTNRGVEVGAGTERFASGPIERLRGGLAPLVLYPLLALLSFPTLGLLVYGRDGVAYSHDVFDLVRSGVVGDWLANGPTLWNTHLTGGNALLAQQAIGPYAIDVPLAMLIGPFGAFAVNSWLLAAVAGIGMHLFMRDVLRLSTVAVLAGAILYTFVFWHPIYGFVVPGLPLLLWLLDGASRRTPVRWRFVVGRVLWIAFVLYNGQSQGVLLVAGLEFAWILVQAGADRLLLRRALAAWFGTWLAGFALYGPVLMTQLVMLPLSQRLIWVLADFLPADALMAAVRTLQQRPVRGAGGAGDRQLADDLRHVLPRRRRDRARGARDRPSGQGPPALVPPRAAHCHPHRRRGRHEHPAPARLVRLPEVVSAGPGPAPVPVCAGCRGGVRNGRAGCPPPAR